ncbi:GGDEF domain-containing protein [Dactylosporangium matsuzakiense]|uniref:GGDEF domain-containing protein n=1 Tax=Dactylosporangium matsuzakiense TaxID=53360 RepID=A0A9W6NMC6_9ACTN|nr:GGDEF domain-containing protein [Dactylosporangium matsuzakiense]GLL02264.1 hypothetical protein GCM10017581_040060 [Dactylosporangium matsuzakiense]
MVRFLAAVALLVGLAMVLYDTDAGNVLSMALYVTLCALTWRAAASAPAGRDRALWRLVALAPTLWCLGDGVEMLQRYLWSVPPVGIADAFWLGGYPVLAAALVGMARRRAPGRLRGAALDALTMTASAALACWQFLIEPVLGLGYGVLQSVVPALYPVGDVTLLAALLFVALSPGRRGAPTGLLIAAITLYLAVDLGYNLLPYVAGPDLVDRLGPLIMFGNALLAAAARHPGRAELTTPEPAERRLHPARVVLLGLALMAAPALTVARTGLNGAGLVALAVTALCVAFVLARFTFAVREQERAEERMRWQAHHDPLTGLANRAVLTDRLEALTDNGSPAAVLYLDLDGFKAVNDGHGHEAGDAVLRAVAARLLTLVRGGDLVARLGGDEFVVLAPGLDAAGASALAARVVDQVARPVPIGPATFAVGASVGVAVLSGTGGADALRAADTAMYQAKRRGRGRWVVAGADAARDESAGEYETAWHPRAEPDHLAPAPAGGR